MLGLSDTRGGGDRKFGVSELENLLANATLYAIPGSISRHRRVGLRFETLAHQD